VRVVIPVHVVCCSCYLNLNLYIASLCNDTCIRACDTKEHDKVYMLQWSMLGYDSVATKCEYFWKHYFKLLNKLNFLIYREFI
jgi:hypothetical protein